MTDFDTFERFFRPRHDRSSHTAPLPAITDAGPYPELAPDTLDTAWELAHEPEGGGYEGPLWNWQVSRALERICELAERGRPDTEIIRRCAVILMADPTQPGTPFRCPQCDLIYTGMDGAPDWGIAGREDALCVPCALKAPRHAAAKPAAKTAAKRPARPSTRRRAATARTAAKS